MVESKNPAGGDTSIAPSWSDRPRPILASEPGRLDWAVAFVLARLQKLDNYNVYRFTIQI